MTVAYVIMFVISLILLVGYIALIKEKEPWLLLLYICVCIVNLGYFLISVSKTVEFALIANKIAYLGSVFLMICMFLSILKLCGFKHKKQLPVVLFAIGALMFALVCTTGYLPWYYKEVTLEYADGASKLIKEYGPLHPLYLIYILAYFAAMLAAIIHSLKIKKSDSHKQAWLLFAVVFGNVGMWLVEKLVPINFEFLSVSYIFSELMLLFLYWMMQDYVHVKAVEIAEGPELTKEGKIKLVLERLPEGVTLHTREREILEDIIDNKKRKDIADSLNLSENTVKTYTRSLYGKIGISGREELYALFEKNK